jgi:hypothetical protein
MGTVEVETAESVNHLEAMAQWAHLGRAKAPFHLYVPAGCVDIARRLAAENAVNVAEIWSYHTIGDQTRFTLVHRAPPPPAGRAGEVRRNAEAAGSVRPAAASKPAARATARKKAPEPGPRRRGAAAKTAAARRPAAKTARAQKRK